KEEVDAALGEMKRAAIAIGVTARVFEIASRAALDEALNAVGRERVGAIFVTSGGPLFTEQVSAELMAFSLKHRIPTMTDFAGPFSTAGSLMTYSASPTEMGQRGAAFADRILRGARPGDLPIELPTKFELLINVRTARLLGITVPSSLLAR